MRPDVYRYEFEQSVAMEEAESTLQLALIAVGSLHGESDVRMDASYAVDEARHAIVIDATCDVGRCICRVFTGFLAREFGEDAFEVRRVETLPSTPTRPDIRPVPHTC